MRASEAKNSPALTQTLTQVWVGNAAVLTQPFVYTATVPHRIGARVKCARELENRSGGARWMWHPVDGVSDRNVVNLVWWLRVGQIVIL